MFLWRSKERRLKMVWEVAKAGNPSYLIGTAHFFPFSFKGSLEHYLKDAESVLFEGPLDKESMSKVSRAGVTAEQESHLCDLLDDPTIAGIRSALEPPGRRSASLTLLNPAPLRDRDAVYAIVRDMRPWMAFFTIWTTYLELRGWRYSVDLEAYNMAEAMHRHIVFLETIEEQVEVLESLSLEKMVSFLNNVSRWDGYVREYVKMYLDGNLEGLLSLASGFPSRTFTVIERRDQILFERMLPYLEKGRAVAFVGSPHVRGIRQMLLAKGYAVSHAQSKR
jgi:uncharacterized protein YbaP (TraB family)